LRVLANRCAKFIANAQLKTRLCAGRYTGIFFGSKYVQPEVLQFGGALPQYSPERNRTAAASNVEALN
jgi:hypothetical protein